MESPTANPSVTKQLPAVEEWVDDDVQYARVFKDCFSLERLPLGFTWRFDRPQAEKLAQRLADHHSQQLDLSPDTKFAFRLPTEVVHMILAAALGDTDTRPTDRARMISAISRASPHLHQALIVFFRMRCKAIEDLMVFTQSEALSTGVEFYNLDKPSYFSMRLYWDTYLHGTPSPEVKARLMSHRQLLQKKHNLKLDIHQAMMDRMAVLKNDKDLFGIMLKAFLPAK